MKQENPQKSRKKVWLIVAIIAAVVAIGVALALILPGLLQPQEQGGETLENPQVYFNLDRTQMIDPETSLSTRTPGEDGLYHFRFSVYGEVKEVSVINDKKLVNYMDTMDVLCPVFDANGVITDVQSADQYFVVTKDLYVKRILNGNLEANSSTAMNGMDMKFAMNEASGIYDCRLTAANPGTPSEASWLDKIITVTDKEKTFAHIYIVDNMSFDGEVAWRAEVSMYDSTKQATKREPDENGVYTMQFFIDGKLVERKSKNKDKVGQIDKISQYVSVVALKYDEEGYIIDWFSPSFVLRGFELCKGYTVTAVENGTFTATRLLAGTMQGDIVEATYDDTTKIWMCCRGCNANEAICEKVTELKVGDLVCVYTDLDGKPIEIYVGLRQADSPMYYNVARKWSTAEAKSTRKPDAEGYYTIDLAVNGKVKQFKTKNFEHVNFIDSLYYFTVGLKTSGNIIKEVYAGNCVCGYTGAFVNRYVSNVVGTVVSVVLPPDLDAGKNYLTSGKCEIYDVSGDYGTTKGQKTTLKTGDKVIGFINTDSKLTHVYVTQHYNEGMTIAYNITRKYDSKTLGTSRTPNADGYYVFDLAINGAVKQYKTKNKAMADFIDQQSPTVVGVKVSGSIIKDVCFARSAVPYGGAAHNNHRVDNTKGNVLTAYTITNGVRTDSTLQYAITSKTKIYNVSPVFDKQQGEKTKLKAGDQITAIVNSGTKELEAIYVRNRAVKCDLYWNAARVTGTHVENGVTVTNRTPDADGYYVFSLLHNGKTITAKTKDLTMATQIDANSQAFGLILNGDVIKQYIPLASTSHFHTAAANYDITKVTGSTVYSTRLRLSASDYGTEAEVKYNKNTKFINTVSSSPNFGKIVTPKVGDRIVMYSGGNGVATYGFITQENSHQKGVFSYCPHCNKTVFWDAYSETNTADGVHCYLKKDTAIGATYVFGSATDKKNYDFVLDLNGYTLSGSVPLVNVNDKLTILDTVGGGKIDGGVGGNIRVNSGATLTVLSGSIVNGTTTLTGIGGNIYADNGTVNIKGGTISGGVSYLGSNIYHAGTKGSVNITGGKIIDGSVYAENSKIINVSGNVEINNLIVKPGNIINVGKLSSGASVTVKADGVFTNNGAASYIKNFKVTDAADAIAASGTALKYTNNSGVVVPSKPSVNDPLNLDANSEALCMVCGEKVKWVPVHDGEVIGNMRYDDKFINNPAGTKYHFYIADDNMISGNTDFLYTYNYANVCLHLNGKTANIKGGIYGGNQAVLNIMGEGTLNHLGTATGGTTKTRMFHYYTASLNLYGGTYESNETAFNFANTAANVKISADAVVNETINLNQSKLTIEGNAQIQKIDITGNAKLTVDKSFTGSALINIPAENVKEGLIRATNGAATGDFTGSVITTEGNVIKNQNGRLAVTATKVTVPTFTDEDINIVDPTVFDPANNNGEAYCSVCNRKVIWTALNAQNPIAGTTNANSHFYFAENYTDTSAGRLINAGKDSNGTATTVCLNLNGKAVTTNSFIKCENTCTTNIMDTAGGSITYTGTDNLIDAYTATLAIYGGTYNSTTGNVLKQQKSNWQQLYGNTTINGKVVLDGGNTATNLVVRENASISELEVGTKGKLIVAKDWAGTIEKVTFANTLVENKVPTANASADVFTGTITMADGRELTKDPDSTQLVASALRAPKDVFDLNTYSEAWCEACQEYVAKADWTAVAGDACIGSVGDKNGAKTHYYLADNGSYTDGEFFAGYNGTFCLYLNGKTKTLGGRISLAGPDGTFNVIGNGAIVFEPNAALAEECRTELFDVSVGNGTINFYGGTFTTTSNVPLLQLGAAGTAANIKGSDVSFTGNVAVTSGVFTLDQNANATKITVANTGKLVVSSTWTGTAVADFAAALVNNVVPEANGVSTGSFTGNLTMVDGKRLFANEGKLALEIPFDPASNNGVAYCIACGSDQTWTPINAAPGAVAADAHYYLTSDITLTETAWFMDIPDGVTVHFNMNSYSVTANAEQGTNVLQYGIRVKGGTLELLNTSARESVLSTDAYSNTYGSLALVDKDSSRVTLHSNVKVCATSGPNKPAVTVYRGTFVMVGGTVYSGVAGVQGVLVGNVASGQTAAFVMNGGTVINAANSEAIKVGSSGADNKVCIATLNSGTINGTVRCAAGSVVLDQTINPGTRVSVGSRGKLVVNSTWTGTGTASFDAGLTSGMVAAKNGATTGDFIGTLRLYNGGLLVNNANRLQEVTG